MKASELRELSADQLRAKEKEFREEEFRLRFKHATGQLEKTGRLRQLRKEVARVRTILTEKEAS